MGKPAARMGDMHTCPMSTGTVPHVGGPINPVCSTDVNIGGLPAARVNDMVVCAGSVDQITAGSTTVFINGKPAARMGDPTGHGGIIAAGYAKVNIG